MSDEPIRAAARGDKYFGHFFVSVVDGRGAGVPERGSARRRSNHPAVAGGDERDIVERQLRRLHGSQRAASGRRQRVHGSRRTPARPDQLRVHRGVAVARHQQRRHQDRQGELENASSRPLLDGNWGKHGKPTPGQNYYSDSKTFPDALSALRGKVVAAIEKRDDRFTHIPATCLFPASIKFELVGSRDGRNN